MIDTPGVHDISEDEYHSDPCPVPSLSNSMCKILTTQSAKHAWMAHPRLNPNFKPEERGVFDLGTAAHDQLLTGGKNYRVLDFPDWRTKAAKEARDEAREMGFTPILKKDALNVAAMEHAARKQLAIHDEGGIFQNGKPEQTIVWQEGNVWCRARLDWLPSGGSIFPDYKSTGASANPDEWQRTAFNIGADIQAAFYCRGLQALGLCNDPHFLFIVQENTAPYALSVIEMSPGAMALGAAKVDRAINYWRWCTQHDAWPGYSKHTAYIDAPPWEENKFESVKLRAEIAQEAGEDERNMMMQWQSPEAAA